MIEGIMTIFLSLGVCIAIPIICSQKSKKNEQKSIEAETLLKQYMPGFNLEKFLDDGYKNFSDIQLAIYSNTVDNIRDKVTDELYVKYTAEAKKNINKKHSTTYKLGLAKLESATKIGDAIIVRIRYWINSLIYTLDYKILLNNPDELRWILIREKWMFQQNENPHGE